MQIAVVSPEPVAVDEVRLSELESIIGAGMRSFVDVGNALAEVRDSGLYRANYRTFEAYVSERWGWNRSAAYKYIAAAEVQGNVSSQTQLPTMTHATLLSAFSSEQQVRMAPKIAELTVKDATKLVKQWRDVETGTNPVSTAARKEIREALHEDDQPSFLVAWLKASTDLNARMGEMSNDDLAQVADGIRTLAGTYNAVREARRG